MKLSKIHNEISLSSGMASTKDIYSFAAECFSDINADIEDVAERLQGEFASIGMYGYERDQLPDIFAEIQKQKLSQKLYDKVHTRLVYVVNDGQYGLGMYKGRYSGDVDFYLVDNKAENPGKFFVGLMRTELRARGYHYNLKKTLGLTAYEVHWSFVPKEVQGTGIGKRLYSMVYEYISSKNAVMYSDTMLFEGSSRMWRTYMPTIAEYFGFQIEDVMLPCTAEEVAKIDWKNAKKVELVDGFVAMDNPPKLIRKMAYNTTGLSFFKGEFGVVKIDASVNDSVELNERGKTVKLPFYNAIKSFSKVKDIIKSLLEGDLKYVRGGWPVFAQSRGSKAVCVFLAFEDAILCVKEVGGDLVIVAI